MRFNQWGREKAGRQRAGYTASMIRLGRYLTPSVAALFLLLVLTLVVRVGVTVAMQDNLRQDPDAYRNIADNLTWHRVYGMGHSRETPPQPTAYRAPVYTLMLAELDSDDGGVLQGRVAYDDALFGMGEVWL